MASHVVSTKDLGSYAHINTLGTSNVVVGRDCVLGSVNINSKGGTGNTITIQDGSGNTVAVFDSTITAVSYFYGCILLGGLTIVNAGGTSGDITVTYA